MNYKNPLNKKDRKFIKTFSPDNLPDLYQASYEREEIDKKMKEVGYKDKYTF
jgi:hypothetical protein